MSGIPVFLEEETLSEGVYVIYREFGDYTRAAYDPRHADRATAEALLRVELGRSTGKPIGLVISFGGSLVLGPLDGEPFQVEHRQNGTTVFRLDVDRAPLEAVLELLQGRYDENGHKR